MGLKYLSGIVSSLILASCVTGPRYVKGEETLCNKLIYELTEQELSLDSMRTNRASIPKKYDLETAIHITGQIKKDLVGKYCLKQNNRISNY